MDSDVIDDRSSLWPLCGWRPPLSRTRSAWLQSSFSNTYLFLYVLSFCRGPGHWLLLGRCFTTELHPTSSLGSFPLVQHLSPSSVSLPHFQCLEPGMALSSDLLSCFLKLSTSPLWPRLGATRPPTWPGHLGYRLLLFFLFSFFSCFLFSFSSFFCGDRVSQGCSRQP